MRVVQLMASPFVGGPERQVLGIARNMGPAWQTVFLSFAECGRSSAFLDCARRLGFPAMALEANAPRYVAAVREVAGQLRELRADVLCCNGYKPDVIGWAAARLARVPVVGIAHGWTAATWKVRLNERLDRRVMRWMDAVVCVSGAQVPQVVQSGVASERVHVIPNAIDAGVAPGFDPKLRTDLLRLFPTPPRVLIGAAGRWSPEKGFDVLIDAAARCVRAGKDVGFILFGDGPLRPKLEGLIRVHRLGERFRLAGFRSDLAQLLPCLDGMAIPSFREGLPVVLLEAFAAGLPVVASAVGGMPEVVVDGENGYLVRAGDAADLAERLLQLVRNRSLRQVMGARGRERVERCFSQLAQGRAYGELFASLVARPQPVAPLRGPVARLAKQGSTTVNAR